MCVVAAIEEIHRLHPERAPGGAEQDYPLFRLSDGAPLKRSVIRDALGEAAKREVKKRNAAYFAATSGADAETAEHAARAIGAMTTSEGIEDGEDDADDDMLW